MVRQTLRRDVFIVAQAILWLFFLQLVNEFVAAIYAFGLLGTSIPTEIVAVLLFFSPTLLVLLGPRKLSRDALLALSFVVLLSRPIAVMLDTRGRLLVAGLGVAVAFVWLPALLWWLSRRAEGDGLRERLGLPLLLAVLVWMFLRIYGSGLDCSVRYPFFNIGWILALMATLYLVRKLWLSGADQSDGALGQSVAFDRLTVWVLGLSSALLLLYFAFASPNVIARWAEASYSAIVIVMVVAVSLFVVAGLVRLHVSSGWYKGLLLGLNILFVLALVSVLRIQQLRFPAEPTDYPFYAPDVVNGLERTLPLFTMLLFYPVVVLDASVYMREIVTAQPSLRSLGGAFAVGALYWLSMVLAHVFTTVYDYIPFIGPAFRDRFWLVHLIVGLGLVLPLLTVRRLSHRWVVAPRWVGTAIFLGVLAVLGVFITRARPTDPVAQPMLTVLTYNIQQGYSEDGQQAADDQLAVMRDVNADLIGLQESDTNRIAGGNADLVRYYADALDMHAYYGPTPVVGTFGIALLSRYPIEQPRTFYMYSEGEQTATIEAQITVGVTTYSVFVTHLGNHGPMVQQEAVLEAVGDRQPVILMGDFNFRPDTPQYALTTARLDDAWLRRWPDGIDDRGFSPPKRIDHIFVSRTLTVDDARYIDSPASDHPAMMAVLRP